MLLEWSQLTKEKRRYVNTKWLFRAWASVTFSTVCKMREQTQKKSRFQHLIS